MSEERFSDLAVIATYYSETFAQIEVEVDEICQRLNQEDPFELVCLIE